MVSVAQAPVVNEAAESSRMGLGRLVAELKRQLDSRVDFVADARQLRALVKDGKVFLAARSGTQMAEFLPTENAGGAVLLPGAVGQFCEKLNVSVPKLFADRLAATHADIAADLFNGLLQQTPERRLIRVLDGKIRAVLSNRYRLLDHYDIAANALQAAHDFNAEVIEAHLTPDRMTLKLVRRDIWDTVNAAKIAEEGRGSLASRSWLSYIDGGRFGDGGNLPGGRGTVHPMLTISNSETGHGGYSVRLGALFAVCVNGLVVSRELSAVHLGGELPEGMMSDETRQADAKAIMLKARDIVRASFTAEKFQEIAGKLRGAAAVPVADPSAALDNIVGLGWLNEEQRDAVFARFLTDYEPTALGMANAISRVAQDTEEADRAFDLEESAGRVIQNPRALVAVK